MDEISFLGITISTFVNFFVAVGTILMAYFTYIAVRTSQKQFLIFQREKERPQAFDQVQTVFNVIQQDLQRELDVIDRSAIVFSLNDSPNSGNENPLVFPISARKNFFRNFRKSFCGESVLSDKRILHLINSTDICLHKRFDTYQTLSGKMSLLETEIETQFIQPNYPNLISKIPGWTVQVQSSVTGPTYQTYRENRKMDLFYEVMMKKSISNLILRKLFESIESPSGYVMSLISDLILEDFNNNIRILFEQNRYEKFYEIKKEIDQDLTTLKATDELILNQVQEIKAIYRDMFLLTSTELEPPKNTW